MVFGKNINRFGAITCFQNFVSNHFEASDRQPTDAFIVLNHKNRSLGLWIGVFFCPRGRFWRAAIDSRKIKIEGSSESNLAVDRDMAAAMLCEAVDHGQAKPGTTPLLLGREEWL